MKPETKAKLRDWLLVAAIVVVTATITGLVTYWLTDRSNKSYYKQLQAKQDERIKLASDSITRLQSREKEALESSRRWQATSDSFETVALKSAKQIQILRYNEKQALNNVNTFGSHELDSVFANYRARQKGR